MQNYKVGFLKTLYEFFKFKEQDCYYYRRCKWNRLQHMKNKIWILKNSKYY